MKKLLDAIETVLSNDEFSSPFIKKYCQGDSPQVDMQDIVDRVTILRRRILFMGSMFNEDRYEVCECVMNIYRDDNRCLIGWLKMVLIEAGVINVNNYDNVDNY